MIRFIEHAGNQYRVLLQKESGSWLISYDDPTAPIFVDASTFENYLRIETPEQFLLYWNQEILTEAERKRLELIQPLLDDEQCISDKKHRLIIAKECASRGDSNLRRVLRLYYRRLATGILTEKKPRQVRSEPNFDWAIRTFYFSSKRFSLRAAYEMMLAQRYTDTNGVLMENLPTWLSFEHYYYRRGFHKLPQRTIARERLYPTTSGTIVLCTAPQRLGEGSPVHTRWMRLRRISFWCRAVIVRS